MHPIEELIASYNELNSCRITELHDEPSALEFMRFVSRNTPFVIRQAASEWPASKEWNALYLRHALGNQPVRVAITPDGYVALSQATSTAEQSLADSVAWHWFSKADAPVRLPNRETVFAKPCEEDQPFSEFLEDILRQEEQGEETLHEVRYAQTRRRFLPCVYDVAALLNDINVRRTENDNLRNEYESLFAQVLPEIAFARIALQQQPEAINLWIGNSRSVTVLHKDNYENIYVQILGRKHFVLLPPCCYPCVNEQGLRSATYERLNDKLQLKLDQTDEEVPFAIWDPDFPEEAATAFSKLAQPMRVTLEPGDMLYLPSMWYHKVSQSCSREGICVAVNYWYVNASMRLHATSQTN
jgi:peptidyl-lysine (3S)-dioxygenase / protease